VDLTGQGTDMGEKVPKSAPGPRWHLHIRLEKASTAGASENDTNTDSTAPEEVPRLPPIDEQNSWQTMPMISDGLGLDCQLNGDSQSTKARNVT